MSRFIADQPPRFIATLIIATLIVGSIATFLARMLPHPPANVQI